MNPRLAAILSKVADHCGVTVAEMLSKDRHKSISTARMVAMYTIRCYVTPQQSYPELGRLFGRDHTTAISAVRRVEKLRATDPWIDQAITAARGSLSSSDADRAKSDYLAKCAMRDEYRKRLDVIEAELAGVTEPGAPLKFTGELGMS